MVCRSFWVKRLLQVLEGKQNMKDRPHAELTEISLMNTLKPRSDRYIDVMALDRRGIQNNEFEKTWVEQSDSKSALFTERSKNEDR